MIRILKSTWLAVVLGVLAYVTTTVLLLRPDKLIAQRQALQGTNTAKITKIDPSWAFKNPEVDELLADLRTQREALKVREQELNDLTSRLAVERQEIGVITQRVVTMQAEMDRTFLRIQEQEFANLKRLAKVYATMSPEGAAKIMLESPEDAAVKILSFMKESETAPILESMATESPLTARRASQISDRLRLLAPTYPTTSCASHCKRTSWHRKIAKYRN